MGGSWSNGNGNSRRRSSYPPPPPPHHYYYYSHPPPLMPPPPPPPPPHGYFLPSTNNHSSTANYIAPPSQSHPQFYSNYGYAPPPPCLHYQQQPFYSNNNNDIPMCEEGIQVDVDESPPSYYAEFENETAAAAAAAAAKKKKIRNDVNLHKHSLCLHLDPNIPDHHLISFVFDALYDGRITIFYLAKEEENCSFIPLFPEAFQPITFPFQKGAGQKFCQPSGTGIDLGFFELDDLSKPSPEEDVFPLVICAETNVTPHLEDETPGISMVDASPHMQITQAILQKSNGSGPFQVKVVRQILWIDGVRYELRELYGIGNSTAEDFEDYDPVKECVVCMTEPKDTAVLPCRHMCMCSECAKALRIQSNKCPICRQPIEELIEIKINNGDQ